MYINPPFDQRLPLFLTLSAQEDVLWHRISTILTWRGEEWKRCSADNPTLTPQSAIFTMADSVGTVHAIFLQYAPSDQYYRPRLRACAQHRKAHPTARVCTSSSFRPLPPLWTLQAEHGRRCRAGHGPTCGPRRGSGQVGCMEQPEELEQYGSQEAVHQHAHRYDASICFADSVCVDLDCLPLLRFPSPRTLYH